MAIAREHELDTPRVHDNDMVAAAEPEELGGRFGGGAVPAVAESHAAGGGHTASEMAYDVASADDPHTDELKRKVGAMVDKHFGGDYEKAFAHYDSDRDGGVDSDELGHLLKDAGIGNIATRGMWVKGIIDKLDGDGDRRIQWREFESVFKTTAAA